MRELRSERGGFGASGRRANSEPATRRASASCWWSAISPCRTSRCPSWRPAPLVPDALGPEELSARRKGHRHESLRHRPDHVGRHEWQRRHPRCAAQGGRKRQHSERRWRADHHDRGAHRECRGSEAAHRPRCRRDLSSGAITWGLTRDEVDQKILQRLLGLGRRKRVTGTIHNDVPHAWIHVFAKRPPKF